MHTLVLPVSQGKQARNDINLCGGKMSWGWFGVFFGFFYIQTQVGKIFREITQAEISLVN